jgi:crossover junction endodeoxyribonuclease RusA
MSAAGTEFRNAVIAEVSKNPVKTILGRVSVKATLHAPTLRKYDIDNFFKSAGDALTHAGVWGDDEQIDSLLLCRGEKFKGGKMIVEVTEL